MCGSIGRFTSILPSATVRNNYDLQIRSYMLLTCCKIWLHRREMPGPFGGQCTPCFAPQCLRFEQAAPCTVQPASSNSQLAKRQAALRLTVIEDDGTSRFPSYLLVFLLIYKV